MWLAARDSSILGEETFLSRLCNLEDLGIKIREGIFLYHKKPLQIIEKRGWEEGKMVDKCPHPPGCKGHIRGQMWQDYNFESKNVSLSTCFLIPCQITPRLAALSLALCVQRGVTVATVCERVEGSLR